MDAPRDDGLLVLQLTLETGPDPLVRLSLCFAEGHEPETIWTAGVPAADVGMPHYARGEDLDDGVFQLPAETTGALRAELAGRHAAAPLFLQLVEPIGYLGLVPWEQLLAAVSDGPILRLPTIALSPRVPADDLQVLLLAAVPNKDRPGVVTGLLHSAIRGLGVPPVASAIDAAARQEKVFAAGTGRTTRGSASAPPRQRPAGVDMLTAEDVESVVDAILAGSPRVTTVHVLTTPWIYQDLRLRWRSRPRDHVRLHNPRQLAERVGPSSADAQELPLNATWLRLAEAALDGEQADVVHLLCHASLYGSQVRLTFADAPVGATASRSRHASIEAMQTLLTVLGAWSLAVTSPPGNPATPQLRLAAARLAEVRPGPVSFTDLSTDDAAGDIASAYAFLYAPDPVPVPRLAAGMVISEPHRVGVSAASMDHVVTSPGIEGVTADSLLLASLREPDAPAWVAAAQRLIEQFQTDLVRVQRDAPKGSATSVGQQASAGVQDAIHTIQNLVARYITETGDRRDQ